MQSINFAVISMSEASSSNKRYSYVSRIRLHPSLPQAVYLSQRKELESSGKEILQKSMDLEPESRGAAIYESPVQRIKLIWADEFNQSVFGSKYIIPKDDIRVAYKFYTVDSIEDFIDQGLHHDCNRRRFSTNLGVLSTRHNDFLSQTDTINELSTTCMSLVTAGFDWTSRDIKADDWNANGELAFSLRFPNSAGKYMLMIIVEYKEDDLFVLDYLSDVIDVKPQRLANPSSTISMRRDALKSFDNEFSCLSLRQTMNYRLIDLRAMQQASDSMTIPATPGENNIIIIKEDYGSTVGSHIYDCSIIFIKFLEVFLSQSLESSRQMALELGAGCGLLSIWLAKRFQHVYSTDQENILSLLQYNLTLNMCEQSNVEVSELNWADETIVRKRATLMNEKGKIDLIVAGDIFYDLSIIDNFFSTMEILVEYNPTACILVAQKIRLKDRQEGIDSELDDKRTSFRDMCAIRKFSAVEQHSEAYVIIWRLYHIPW